MGDTFAYTITSSGGGTAVTGSGSVTSATQDVTAISVSSLPDGTLTFSVTLTDPAGNTGAAATATATLDQTAPSGYTISSDASTYNATTATAAGFTFANAEVGDTFAYTITSSGGTDGRHRQRRRDFGHSRRYGINLSSLPDGTLTFSVTLTNAAGNTGGRTTATATLDQTAPSGYTISSDASTYNATSARPPRASPSPTPKWATRLPTPSAAPAAERPSRQRQRNLGHPNVTAINVSSLPDGTLTFSVTLTDPAGNTGVAATATATLDQTAPSGYSITADSAHATTPRPRHSAGFTVRRRRGGRYLLPTRSSSSGGGRPCPAAAA